MTDFLIFARRRDIRKISLKMDYFADVVIPLGELRNAIAIGVDSIRGTTFTYTPCTPRNFTSALTLDNKIDPAEFIMEQN